MSPIIFHNLFDDDEPELDTDPVSEVAVPVLYSVEELYMLGDSTTTAMDEGEEGTDNVTERDKENLTKANHSSDLEINKPVKKLKPSRPLKHRKVVSDPLSAPRSSNPEPSKDPNSSVVTKVENSDGGEDSASAGNDERKEITLKMGARNSKLTDATVNEEALAIQTKQSRATLYPTVVQKRKIHSDEELLFATSCSDTTVLPHRHGRYW